ncbi:MAG: DEAD/DEAH box helicase, partial [Nanoarchaeota archaeon]|nr:DEAD/DEAH box helicase [Nanoarchaeota archaeon]
MTINVGDKVRVGNQVGEVTKIEQFGESTQYRIYFSDGLRSIFSPPTEIEKINSPIEMIKNLQFDEAHRFDLLTEATRLSLAYEYDHLLSLSSTRTFLEPYQVEAVYKVLSAFKQRFLIADDVGLGKTIEGGMIMKELIARGRGNRILITVPASLQLQWKDEMYERFDENFVIYNSAFVNSLKDSLPKDANVWEHYNKIITSLDYAKQENVKAELRRATWNLIVFDEAHKLSNPKGSGKTLRYKLGESIKDQADNLLLLTATPHNGDSFAFYSIIRLIDPYIFKDPESISPDKLQRVMIRRGKKGIKDSEGKPVFKDRIVKSVPIEYSKKEQELYEAVTEYVKHEYNLAQKQGNRAYGFAMIILQKRMASSICAITKSLKNRLEKVLKKVHTGLNEDEIRILRRYHEGTEGNEQFGMEDFDPVEIEWLERKLETMTLDKTPEEFQIEIDKLKELIKLAEKTDVDTKAETVINFIVETLKKNPKEKILVFTEYKDTLNYLNEKIKGKRIETAIIHGDIKVGQERKAQEDKFKDPNVNVMVATEAAGEGINLQFCHIMINNDLPWNPNRIDQRIGRLHRYLQKKDVYVHNLVTTTTREGKIFLRLIEKINIIEKQLGGSISNILGTLLREVNLEALIMEALSKEKTVEVSLKDIEEATQRGLDAYSKMDEKMLMSFKKFDLDSIMKVIEKSREKTVSEKDIENFVNLFFNSFGGLIEKTRYKDMYRLVVPKVLVNEQVGKVYGKVTFLKEVAKANYPSDVEFIAFGHPLLTNMIDFCKKRDDY